jgi:hypothetical protein
VRCWCSSLKSLAREPRPRKPGPRQKKSPNFGAWFGRLIQAFLVGRVGVFIEGAGFSHRYA